MSSERRNPWSRRTSPLARGRSPTPPPLRRADWDEPGTPAGGHRPHARPQHSGENLYVQFSPRRSAAPSRRPTPSPNASGRRYRPLGEGGAEHWTLQKDTDHSSHMNLTKLPHKLTPTNYVSWMTTMESTLDTIELFEYATGEVPEPDPDIDEARVRRWKRANACVRLILVSNMTEEVVLQISHLTVAAQVWQEVRRLFAGETLTDWTLLITSLVTTKYADGEDLTLHIAKMKAYRRDLILMSRNIPDDLYACFIRISMPQSWNYVFSGLSQYYTSSEIERCLKEEYAIRQNQQSTARAYNAKQQSGKQSKKEYKPGDPFCKNCERPGHYIKDCWSKGGGAEGKGPRSKKKEKKDSEKQDVKGKERVNEVKEDSDHLSCMAAPGSSSRFTWILDGGSTTHICRTKTAFVTFTPSSETISSIRKTGPQLEVHGRGDILILCHIGSGDEHIVTLRNVCYCPDAHDNIISESRMDQKGLSIHKQNGLVAIQNSNGKIIMEVPTPPSKTTEIPAASAVTPQPKPAATTASPGDEEAARRRARAERFGIPVVEPEAKSDAPKASARGKGSGETNAKAEQPSPDDTEKMRKRAARFGVVQPVPAAASTGATPNTGETKGTQTNGRKRSAPATETVDAEELERRKKRAERFGIPVVGAKA